MQEVKTLNEAMNFFLRNHEDSIICVKGEKKLEVECYPEAEEFFK